MTPLHLAAVVCEAVAVLGLVQALLGRAALGRFLRRAPARAVGDASLPAITVLKPLHGAEPLLAEALASFCAQDYPRFEIVFGVQDPADPAIATVQALRARFPAVAMTLVVEPCGDEPNRKIANLMNMLPEARHELLVIADSDIHVRPTYLRALAAALAVPGVGLVTTLYTGRPAHRGLVGRLGAAHINHVFLPGVLLARALGRRDCLGATMALPRRLLDRLGGLQALADHLADDAMLGHLVTEAGYEIGLAGTVPQTTVPERRLGALLQHELRWARTNRALEPAGFALSAMQFPLAWSLFALPLAGLAPWALLALLGVWGVRALAAGGVDADLALARGTPIWLLPIRDLLSLGMVAASFTGNKVVWRDQVMRASGKGARAPNRAAATRALLSGPAMAARPALTTGSALTTGPALTGKELTPT